MASKQRSRAPRAARAPNPLMDLGILDIPDLEMMEDDESDVDESALESELEAILSGKAPSKPSRPKKKVALHMDIESMAAACLKDPDEEEDDDDSALMDPDLLKELQGLSCDSPSGEVDSSLTEEVPHMPDSKPAPKTGDIISLLEGRLNLYNEALTAAKDILKDNSKVRRYTRAIKTLEGLLKSAKSGRNVNEEDIPPIVSIPTAGNLKPFTGSNDKSSEELSIAVGTQERPSEGVKRENSLKMDQDLKSLMYRRDEYKIAALHAKRAGDRATALMYVKISKSFDSVIESLKNGESVDMSILPTSPPTAVPDPQKGLQETQTSSIGAASGDSSIANPKNELQETRTSSMEAAALSAASEPEDPAMFSAPPAPTSILEALQQRLEKYSSTKDAAIAEGNNGKVRRLQRIIKSYENAVRDYKAGKTINFEELPTPPGFAPIPVPSQLNKNATAADKTVVIEKNPSPSEIKPPAAPKRPAPQVPQKNSASQKPKLQRTNTSTVDKQLEFLMERQKLFRQAALAAKKNDDIQQAKEYLRMSKGFDSMIEATKCGLPIDASSIPTPPQLQSDFVIVEVSECLEHEEGSTAELLETLLKDMTQQIEVCTRNKEHFFRLGDVSSASKFEKLGMECRKDLSVIRHLKKTGGPAPKFHYETRLFSIVQCHPDLSDNDLEVTVEKGINLPGKPDDLDSYVKLDIPIPSADSPQRAKTHTIRDTNNPIFQEEFKFEINRKSRAQLRQFKRQALKLEVWTKGGFLRSDTLLGTVNVKLVDLETKCTIHDCFDLLDGRKACGGKLQVKLRIRDPLLVKQVEEVREKWLVIGS